MTQSFFSTQKLVESRELLIAKLAELAMVFAAPARLGILMTLNQGPCAVEEIAERNGLSIANASQHLQKMAKANLLKVQKSGVQRIYALANTEVYRLLVALQDAGREVLPAIRDLERILLPEELLSQKNFLDIKSDVLLRKAQLLDVRSASEANAVPVPHAKNIPVESSADLTKIVGQLSKDLPIYVFCRGAYCATAATATGFLRDHGFQAYCLRQTGLDWQRNK